MSTQVQVFVVNPRGEHVTLLGFQFSRFRTAPRLGLLAHLYGSGRFGSDLFTSNGSVRFRPKRAELSRTEKKRRGYFSIV